MMSSTLTFSKPFAMNRRALSSRIRVRVRLWRLRIFGLIPGVEGGVFFITGIWRLAAMVVAVRQALDYSTTWRAVVVCLIGFLIDSFTFMLLVWFLLGTG